MIFSSRSFEQVNRAQKMMYIVRVKNKCYGSVYPVILIGEYHPGKSCHERIVPTSMKFVYTNLQSREGQVRKGAVCSYPHNPRVYKKLANTGVLYNCG